MTDDNGLVFRKDGSLSVAYGRDAVNMVGAAGLAAALRLYARSGLRWTRHHTPTQMLKAAGRVTGKTYKRGEYIKAADDLSVWVQEMKAALPQETRE